MPTQHPQLGLLDFCSMMKVLTNIVIKVDLEKKEVTEVRLGSGTLDKQRCWGIMTLIVIDAIHSFSELSGYVFYFFWNEITFFILCDCENVINCIQFDTNMHSNYHYRRVEIYYIQFYIMVLCK